MEHNGKNWFNHAPWWLISGGLHVVLLLAATLFYVERHLSTDEGTVILTTRPAEGPKISELEKPRGEHEIKGVRIDDDRTAASNEDPIIVFPDAKDSDHNESADNMDLKTMRGDSLKFLYYVPGDTGGLGRLPGNVPGSHDRMGVGFDGGSGGRHGDPFGGGRENLRKIGKIRTKAPPKESAILEALKWLCRHQNSDGSWSAAGFSKNCFGAACGGDGVADHDVGVTGLALLAFLGAGYTHLTHDEFPDPVDPKRTLHFGQAVKKGVQWLVAHQDADGCVGARGPKYMYSHAIAALALCEAYGMTQAGILKSSAQRAIDFIVAAQSEGKAWRYEARIDNDSSVTGWCVMALKSAELSDLLFPEKAFKGALAWFNEVTETNGYYRTGYTAPGQGKVYDKHNQDWSDHPALTAVGVMSRIFIERKRTLPVNGGVNLLVSDLPKWASKEVDYYYWYYASLALYQFDGPTGPFWTRWSEPLLQALLPNQKKSKDGCATGSWETEIDRWSHEGGRVYATAINALSLEAAYRYANVFGGKK